ncbi:MAG TPA: DUF4097 family beta strand repeat-containing protein [Candidatus Krumholzibacteria bacterium]|nr:DUF4097 family beta strand repeat-containing protein [Candidatus Krumholzibacteria bacterium]HPD73095.1 DUF4097 family beta strand repeat-containing protein [Candidatus Krumholzibacteria bacterium]HRY41895.1 DUF4097 family beta strand repeat-containing protein [Candidatus Krumholzibacteria bacterium]
MRIRKVCSAPLALVLVVAASAAAAAEFSQDLATAARELTLDNLIGEVRVEPAPGDRFEIRVDVRGEDADPSLILVKLEDGGKARLTVQFPIEEHRSYVYPKLGRGESTTIWQPGPESDEGGWLRKVWRGVGGEKIKVRGSGRGLEVWADVTLRVPAGRSAEVHLGAGEITSGGVDGELVLDTHSGAITVDRHAGELVCDTGSGSVQATDIDGALFIDTGSGAVEVANQRGGSLKVDTGSGSVDIDGADTGDLYVDTGSGGVRARRIRTDKARIDTGSGAVELELDRMGAGRFVIDTGSGSVHLVLPAEPSATITVDVGSGAIRADVPGAEVVYREDDALKLRIGEGEAAVSVDTGSGGVTIASR